MTTIYWAGDSTVKQNSIATWPQTGIGQEFGRFLNPRSARVENHAENGRSSRSYIEEGLLAIIEERIRIGDFLFIQFGHNDEKQEDPARYADPEIGFPACLGRFIDVAREHGALPVIITPVTRCCRNAPSMLYHHDLWAESARKTGERLGVPVIDLTAASERLVDATPDAGARFYMNLPAGVYPAFPRGQRDNTHLQPAGAVAFGALIAQALYRLGSPYADVLCEDFPKYLEQAAHSGATDIAAESIEG